MNAAAAGCITVSRALKSAKKYKKKFREITFHNKKKSNQRDCLPFAIKSTNFLGGKLNGAVLRMDQRSDEKISKIVDFLAFAAIMQPL